MKDFKHAVLHAMLPHIILTQAAAQPVNGYAIIKLLRAKYGVFLSPSVIYPGLAQLEREGLVKSEWSIIFGRPRRMYSITARGHMELVQMDATISLVTYAQVVHSG